MTILESTISLFDWFKNNDSFSIDDPVNLTKLKINTEADIAAFTVSLDRLEKLEIIKGVEIQKNKKNIKVYVLEKVMQNFNQSITLNGHTASRVSTCLNDFCKKINDFTDLCDPLNITERDILNLVLISDFCEKENVVNSKFIPPSDLKNN